MSSKRNYIERMVNQKVKCMKVAKEYSFDYWDGNRKYGYGGYKYIPGRWKSCTKNYQRLFIKRWIKNFRCRMWRVSLYEIFLINPKIEIHGFDISAHAKQTCTKKIRKNILKHNVKNKFPYSAKNFDLAISLGTL